MKSIIFCPHIQHFSFKLVTGPVIQIGNLFELSYADSYRITER